MIRRLLIALVLAMLAILSMVIPIAAAIAEPDSPPTLEDIDIYRNVLETGDMLLLWLANIPYSTPPDVLVSDAFSWSYRSNDGLTEYGATTGYAYNDNGYGYNVSSIYLTAAEVTAAGIVWGDPYKLRLTASPAHLPAYAPISYDILASHYSSLTVQSAVQAEIASRVITIAETLDVYWGTTTTTSLVEQTESGTKLSTYGEAFFRGAVYGLQGMAPDAFAVVVTAVDVSARTFTTNYTDQLDDQYSGTWVETSREAGKALFGTDYDLWTVIMMVGMCVGLLFGNIYLTSNAWNGLMDVGVIMVFGARLAFYDFFFLLLITALLWVYIGTRLWFRLFR